MTSKKFFALILLVCFAMFYCEQADNSTVSLDELSKMLEEGSFPEPDEDDMDTQLNDAMQALGIEKNGTMDRPTFRKLFTRVILEDEVPQGDEKQIFDRLIDRVVNNAPESFPTSDLNKYVDMNFITSVLNEVMTEAGIDPQQAFANFNDDFRGEDAQTEEEETREENEKADL